MRLINVKTLKFESFLEISLPPYAILSHTWGDDEVEFQQWQASPDTSSSGYKKILRTCAQAERDGLGYCWVDTVCIDKSSSAELQEAINSMYAWYEHAKICYAYLSDVFDSNSPETNSQFQGSKWFTRGWTLQELLAPRHLVFYAEDWEKIDNKENLAKVVSEITNIPAQTVIYPTRISSSSVAEKLSWASNRVTTRLEDTAYCLLGILGVNMPLLYGEGSRAFLRLQEEIIKVCHDETIFAWTWIPQLAPRLRQLLSSPYSPYIEALSSIYLDFSPDPENADADEEATEINGAAVRLPMRRLKFIASHPFWKPHGGSSMLAPDPANFFASSEYKPMSRRTWTPPFSHTNGGLYIHLDVIDTISTKVEPREPEHGLKNRKRAQVWRLARLQCSHRGRHRANVCIAMALVEQGNQSGPWPASPVLISNPIKLNELSSPVPLYFEPSSALGDLVEPALVKQITQKWRPHHLMVHGLLLAFSGASDNSRLLRTYRLPWDRQSLGTDGILSEDKTIMNMIYSDKEWAALLIFGFDLPPVASSTEAKAKPDRHHVGVVFCADWKEYAPGWRCRIVSEDRLFRGNTAVDGFALYEELCLLRATTVTDTTRHFTSAEYLTVSTGRPVLRQQGFSLTAADIYLHGRKMTLSYGHWFSKRPCQAYSHFT